LPHVLVKSEILIIVSICLVLTFTLRFCGKPLDWRCNQA
jgi:hypothetical protein